MKIGVIGATGRMGQAVLQVLANETEHTGVPIARAHATAVTELDVLVDFSLPQALADNMALAKRLHCPLLVCTTGLTEQQRQGLVELGQQLPVLYAENTSIGIALLADLVQQASRLLGEADVDIIDLHHKHKRDAPSGTAKRLAAAVEQGRGEKTEIEYAVVRAGDIIGEHTVLFNLPGERLEFTHKVSERAVFARGAVRAAKWLSEQAPGFYHMADMLR